MSYIRKGFIRLVCFLFFATMFCSTYYASSASSSSYLSGANINVRSKPSASAEIVSSLSNKKVKILSTSGNWSQISYGKIKGWVRNDFIKSQQNLKSKNTQATSTNYSGRSGIIAGTNINIRSSSNTQAKVVAKVSNAQVRVLSAAGDWYRVSCNGKIGWVKKEFVKAATETSRQFYSSSSSTSNTVSTSTKYVNGENINIRSKPDKSAKVIGKLSNKKVTVLSTSGSWYKISYDGVTGWISKDFVSSGKAQKQTASHALFGTITTGNVNVRSKPSTSSKAIAKISKKKVAIIGESGNWYKISSDKTIGWVSKDFIKGSSSSSVAGDTSIRSRMITYSRGFLGTPYVYGGSTPKSGFDCSGFTSYVYRRFGIRIPRTASEQARQGKYVSRENLKPGDLIFFDTDGPGNKAISHTGIYIGDNKFIHASSGSSKMQVTISSLSESFYSKAYVTARTFVR